MLNEIWGNPLLDLLIVVLLAVLNGIFALSELAVVSSRRARLQQRAQDGDKSAQTALEVAEDPTDFLSTVQIGITLVGIGAGAFGGARLADDAAAVIAFVPLLEPYSSALGYTIVVASLTYLSLTVGELIPKAIALNDPERFAMLVAPPMKQLTRVTAPLVWLLSRSTDVALGVLGIEQSDEPSVTEDEIKLILEEGAEAGAIEPEERQLVKHALDLDDITLDSLLTHRSQVDWIDLSDSSEEIFHKVATTPHTYFPICEGNLDKVRAVVRARDLLALLASGDELTSKDQLMHIANEPIFMPTMANPMQALDQFRGTGMHILFAVDEHGGVRGVVTPFDILETIVGEIHELDEMPEEVKREIEMAETQA